MNTKHLLHLYKRAGFGLNFHEIEKLSTLTKKETVKNLIDSSNSFTPLKVISDAEYFSVYKNFKNKTREEKKMIQQMNRRKILELNHAWMDRLFSPSEVLRERMTLFWSNHFVAKDKNVLHFQQYNNLLRKHALGNFKVFVKEVAKSASMLKYLNTKQNKKQQPNENFARELMELFTLGIGNYSEKDIKEAARAFTGWNHNHKGEFRLINKQHDNGEKNFLGKTAAFTGEAIIDHILEQKQCAHFICTKIYSYFVNTHINQEHVDEMVGVFFPNYNIKKLMRFLLLSNWFYKKNNIGTKIKSPVDLLVDINNIVPLKFEKTKQLVYLQKKLGQELLNPVNVAGWKMGKHWIDTNSIMMRLKLPAILLNNAIISLSGIVEFEDSYEMYVQKRKRRKASIKVTQNWQSFDKNFDNLSAIQCRKLLINTPLSSRASTMLDSIEFSDPRNYCVQLMSLPEYQLC